MQSNPFDQFDAAPAAGPVFGPPPKAPAPRDPLAIRKDEIAILKGERDLAKPEGASAPPTGYRWGANGTLEAIPGGPADKSGGPGKAESLAERRARINTSMENLKRLEEIVSGSKFGAGVGSYVGQEDFRAGKTITGNLFNQTANNVSGAIEMVQGDLINQVRNEMQESGAPIGVKGADTEKEASRLAASIANLAQTQDETEFLTGVKRAREYYDRRLKSIDEKLGGEYGSANPTPPAFSPQPTEFEKSSGSRQVPDPETSALIDKMVRAGAPVQAINSMLGSRNMDPIDETAYNEWRTFLSENPDYSESTANAVRNEELSGVDAAGNALGGLIGDDATAFLSGAGQFLSGNTLDNISSNPEAARMGMAQMREDNPGAMFAGEMTGGVLAALTGEGGLARLGMAGGLGRGVAADAAMGAANGAGMADGGDRLTGAVQGGLAATAGSLGGSMLMKGAAGAVSPTGGSLADLYATGVRPTPGQRFVNSGVAGRALNATEEALQSVPIVGAAITGARQEARDQFQVGAFNEALKEIGETLPAGMKPGTDPHRFAQSKFNEVYDRARSGMSLVADEDLAGDLAALAPDIETLGPQAQNKLRAIMRNSVNNKLKDGQIEGGAYKTAVSDLGKHIGRLRKSAMGEDQALADILDDVKGSLDSAARRSSDPEAVALLDAADAGYSRFVRIEDAAARRGGDAGTFSPNNFDSSVQKSSGGVRSKAYLRGDAMMQDYADQGKNLSDRMANSGSADRAMAATTVAGGAAYLEPATLGILGAIGAAYAPGVRKVVKGAMSPGGPTRKAISQQMKKRAQLAGRVGAAGAAVALPGTSPGQ